LKHAQDAPWHAAKKQIASRTRELTCYAMERFPYRLSKSPHRDRFRSRQIGEGEIEPAGWFDLRS